MTKVEYVQLSALAGFMDRRATEMELFQRHRVSRLVYGGQERLNEDNWVARRREVSICYSRRN
jgi:hypothetical protein